MNIFQTIDLEGFSMRFWNKSKVGRWPLSLDWMMCICFTQSPFHRGRGNTFVIWFINRFHVTSAARFASRVAGRDLGQLAIWITQFENFPFASPRYRYDVG